MPGRTTQAGEYQPPRGEVHVWRFCLHRCDDEIAALGNCLAPEERRRARSYRFPRDAARFVVARSLQRQILARYLGCLPGELRFGCNSYGKPHLLPDQNPSDIRFNLSYSHEMGVLAVACGIEVGIDVEYRRQDFPYAELVAGYFSSAERCALNAVPVDRRRTVFYTLWTCKEACGKARGVGLALESVDTATRGGFSIGRGVRHAGTRQWSLTPLDLWPSYAAALAVRCSEPRVVIKDYGLPEYHDW